GGYTFEGFGRSEATQPPAPKPPTPEAPKAAEKMAPQPETPVQSEISGSTTDTDARNAIEQGPRHPAADTAKSPCKLQAIAATLDADREPLLASGEINSLLDEPDTEAQQ